MKAKNVGVFITGDDDQLQGLMIEGIKEKAAELKCNIVVFHSLVNKTVFDSEVELAETVVFGEASVFFGHDISALDAMIIMGEGFQSERIKKAVIKKGAELGIPVINIDDTADDCSNLRYDDTSGMEMVVRHVVEYHGCREVNFISGFEGNRQSEDRILAYKKVLEDNGIPIEKGRIGYGHFYFKAADVARDMIEEMGVPDAIICANDSMALAVIGYLNSIGIRVPEDCIVAGFDGIKEGQRYIPSLTTCKRSITASGARALEMAISSIEGAEYEFETYMSPELIRGQSCGCNEKSQRDFAEFFDMMNGRVNDKRFFNANLISMTRDFASVKELKDIFTIVFRYIGQFNVPEFSFYLCSNIIGGGDKSGELDNTPSPESIYTDTLTCYRWVKGEEGYTVSEEEKEGFIERLCAGNGDEPVFATITPIYFQEKILGFVKYDETCCEEDLDQLCTLLVNISATIGDFCLREEMQYLILRLDNMYVSDNLTGLYNRFGLYRDAELLLKRAKKEDRRVFGIEIDLDRLKYVNDTFGHEAGDNAILQIANAMRYAAELSTVISRTGGDEYFALGFSDSDDAADRFISKVQEFLKNYNEKNRLPYLVDCSCGYYVADARLEDLEEIMKKADVEMYKVKSAKKEARRTGSRT